MNKILSVLLLLTITLSGCLTHDDGVPKPPVQNSVLRIDSIGGCQYVFIYDRYYGVAITHHGGCNSKAHILEGSYGGWDASTLRDK